MVLRADLYIRDVVLEKIVFEAISSLADFVKCHETVFLYMLAKKTNAMRQKEYKRLQQAVEQGAGRIAEIDRLIERIEVHNNDKSSGHCYVKVDIYFTAAGMIDIPTEQEILAMMKEIPEWADWPVSVFCAFISYKMLFWLLDCYI